MTKNEVIEKIKYYTISEESLNAIDSRLHSYIREVLDNPTQHNKYEILAVFRFLDFFQREDLEFKSREVKKFVKFYECLKFPSNKRNAIIQINTNPSISICQHFRLL